MDLKIEKTVTSISKITVQKYNVAEINSIKKEYGALRQLSKAPS
jgi:hypothetical protein